MDDNAYHLKWNHHMQNMYRQLDTLYTQQEFVDVTLSCTDGLLKAHRLILSACSPYFEHVFRDNTCKHPILILKGISTKEMGSLLTFMYKGYVDVLDEDLQSFISTANELKIRGLADELLKESLQGSAQQAKNDTHEVKNTDTIEPNTEIIKVEENSEFNMLNGMQDDNASLENKLEENNDTRNEEMDQREMVPAPGVSHVQTLSASNEEETTSAKTADGSGHTNFTAEASVPYPRDTRFKGRKRVSVGGNEEECKQGCCEATFKKRNLETHSRAGKPPVTSLMCHEKSNTSKPEKHDMGLLSMNTLSESAIKKEKEDVEMFCISSLSECNAGISSDVDEGDKRCSNDTVCAFCFLDCHTSADLKKHLRIHTGEKPYECDLCNLAFSRASHLARHRRVHTGERPFTCLSCGRKFSRQDKLKQHSRRHHELDGHKSYGTGPAGRLQLDAGRIQRPRGRPRIKFDAPLGNKTSGENTMRNKGLLPFGDTSYLSSLSLGQQQYEGLTISPVTESSGTRKTGQNATEDLLQSVRQLGECTIQAYSGQSKNMGRRETAE